MSGWFDEVPEVDLRRANPARMYDYSLGGGHNFAVDRERIELLSRYHANVSYVARVNRAFLGRAVRLCLAEGIEQFLDLGSGIPTVGNVHQAAHQRNPDAHVVYVDNDPVAAAHTRHLLRETPRASMVRADIREPATILEAPETRQLLDFTRPVGLMMVAVLHYVSDSDGLADILTRYRSMLAPGSLVAISHLTADANPTMDTITDEVFADTAAPMVLRTYAEITALFTGLEPVEPGIVWTPRWRPDTHDAAPERSDTWCGVGRKADDLEFDTGSEADGEAAPNWREQQQELLALLRSQLPLRHGDPDQRTGSTAVLADREETNR